MRPVLTRIILLLFAVAASGGALAAEKVVKVLLHGSGRIGEPRRRR